MTRCDGIRRNACLEQRHRNAQPTKHHQQSAPSHHRGTRTSGLSQQGRQGTRGMWLWLWLCLRLCPVLIRKRRETASPSLAAGACPMHFGPSRSFSLRDSHLRDPLLRQNSPWAAIWGSPIPSFCAPRAVQWLDHQETMCSSSSASWKLELDWSRGRRREGRARRTGHPSQQCRKGLHVYCVERTSRPKGHGNTRFPGGLVRLVDHQISRTCPSSTILSSALLARALFWFVPGWVVQTRDRWQGRPA